MEFGDLLVIHCRNDRRKDRALSPVEAQGWMADLLGDAFLLETCLRRIWVTPRTPVLEKVLQSWGLKDQIEFLPGKSGYRFLLSVSTGLESAIPGETDIFGQVKEAWKRFESKESPKLRELRPWFQKLFEDVKEIRSRFLQGMGGSTYGSLCRMLLGPEEGGSILMVGAGQMARSVAPYLMGTELLLWNRSPEKLASLKEKLSGISRESFVRVLGTDPKVEKGAWNEAHTVVLCIPPDPVEDLERVKIWNSRVQQGGTILHLGILDAEGTPWEHARNLLTLSDLFEIQRTQDSTRKAQIDQARVACVEKALLRSLGGPASLAHGWEDLAIFNSSAVE